MPRPQRQTPPEVASALKRTNTREDKRHRFLAHIERRMAEVKRQLEFLENMAGSNYEYTTTEAHHICTALDRWVEAVKTEFSKAERPRLPDFKLGPRSEQP